MRNSRLTVRDQASLPPMARPDLARLAVVLFCTNIPVGLIECALKPTELPGVEQSVVSDEMALHGADFPLLDHQLTKLPGRKLPFVHRSLDPLALPILAQIDVLCVALALPDIVALGTVRVPPRVGKGCGEGRGKREYAGGGGDQTIFHDRLLGLCGGRQTAGNTHSRRAM